METKYVRHAYWDGSRVVVTEGPVYVVDSVDDNGNIHTTSIDNSARVRFNGACCVRCDKEGNTRCSADNVTTVVS